MQQSLPQPLLASEQKEFALSIAQVMLQGFNKHYRIFREACQAAKQRIAADQMQDVFPYAEALRFCNLFAPR